VLAINLKNGQHTLSVNKYSVTAQLEMQLTPTQFMLLGSHFDLPVSLFLRVYLQMNASLYMLAVMLLR
jgi:hypothetical protein